MVGQGRIELPTLGFSVVHQGVMVFGIVWYCLVIVATVHKFHPKAQYHLVVRSVLCLVLSC